MKYAAILLIFLWGNSMFPQDYVALQDIEIAPAFKACKNLSQDERRNCFYSEFSTYVQENLRYPPEVLRNNLKERVYTSFMISGKGKVMNIMVNGKTTSLEDEAIRLISELPKFSPGIHKGKKVTTSVNIPILFSLPPSKENISKATPRPKQFNDSIARMLERVPIFPGCESLSNEEARNCFNNKINEHIRDNFSYPRMAQIKGIQGIVYARFTIGTNSTIEDINLIAPHDLLAEETLRIINLLPPIKPAMQKGRNVRVPYYLQISFKLLSPN